MAASNIGANPNMARGDASKANLKPGNKLGKKLTRYVTAGQLLDSIENKFGKPFADTQADIFFDWYERAYDSSAEPRVQAHAQKVFMNLFMHFSHKLTQNAPQQIEVDDTTERMSTDELKARALEIAMKIQAEHGV